VVVTVDASDPEGDDVELEYRWFVNGEGVDEDGPVLSTRSLGRGDRVRVEVVANDGRSDSAPMSSPVLRVQNGLPAIVSEPEAPGPDGRFRYQLRVEDPEEDPEIRFSLARSPRGMRIDPVRGLVSWIPARDQAGTHPVEVVVEDSAGGSSRQSFELTVGSPPAAPAP
jgi:hypothetical protein